MKEIITLMLSCLMTSANFISRVCDGKLNTAENLLQSAGYPKPGDIPILNRKIFKGHRVSIREHPYTVSIRRQMSHYLTAALLTKNLVIAIAHPLLDVPISELSVVMGENYSDRGSTLFTVVVVIIHENFDRYTLKDDIAMIRIYEEVSYKGNVKPIALIPPSVNVDGHKAFVTAWGRCDNLGTEICLDRSSKYYPDEKMDPMLRTVTFNMNFTNPYCEVYKHHDVTLYPGMLCTGLAREQDQVCPCLGVPGALLVANAHLAGLLSWGFGCGYSYDLPLVYTDLQQYSLWIAHNVKVFQLVRQNNLTELFQATQAYILAQWLRETRDITPRLIIRSDKNFELCSIDNELTKLWGSVNDIRDYIGDGAFHEEKFQLYTDIRNDAKRALINAIAKKPIAKTVPFIGDDTLEEIGFNKSEIFTVSNITGKATVPSIYTDVDTDEDLQED